MRSFTSSTVFLAIVAQYGLAAAQCPAVWTEVATDLKSTFVDSDGKCTDDARAAIRLSFHDCFPGSCDGSVILANECTDRGENAQMIGICDTLGTKATDFDVGVADLIQFAAGKFCIPSYKNKTKKRLTNENQPSESAPAPAGPKSPSSLGGWTPRTQTRKARCWGPTATRTRW